MKIGVPRGFLYYKYRYLWESFFENLGVSLVLSNYTNKEIIKLGNDYSIDEACLSSKIYIGHVASLIGKCDYILVPRVEIYNDGIVCTKFQAILDVCINTFKDENVKFAYYNINQKEAINEFREFLKLGKFLGFKKSVVARAYLIAKQSEKTNIILDKKSQEKNMNSEGIKILIVGHQYNVYDRFIGMPTLNYLKNIGVTPIIADLCDQSDNKNLYKENFPTLPWSFNKELVNATMIYKNKVDGIILMSAFPCGPDSLVNEMMLRKINDTPILNLLLDGQEGTAGIETRLESFVDIIKIKKEEIYE